MRASRQDHQYLSRRRTGVKSSGFTGWLEPGTPNWRKPSMGESEGLIPIHSVLEHAGITLWQRRATRFGLLPRARVEEAGPKPLCCR